MTIGKKNNSVTIIECAPRDGLSALANRVATAEKAKFIEVLSASGLSAIDCVSFHHPRLNPKHADAELVMERVLKRDGTLYLGLVPDEIGCRRALSTAVDGVVTLMAVSERFQLEMLGQTIKERLNKTIPSIFESARKGGKRINAYIQTAFGCPFTGNVQPAQVIDMAARLAYLGADRISFVDNPGMATPKQVKGLMTEVLQLGMEVEISVHFHDTRGAALANCIAAYEVGIRSFDTAVGGLSRALIGAPTTDIGRSNIPTEDLVHVFETMGVSTGIDLDALLRSVEMAEKLAGAPLPGHILRAGANLNLPLQKPN
ncbi:MAG: hydroxymethylglutaryl-CoA lyase [Desulfobacteraceae bacterium]|nr:MAG: hydroxymethylglutaryl-CoA lyase [Desulfobacteraceae bacterium]